MVKIQFFFKPLNSMLKKTAQKLKQLEFQRNLINFTIQQKKANERS